MAGNRFHRLDVRPVHQVAGEDRETVCNRGLSL